MWSATRIAVAVISRRLPAPPPPAGAPPLAARVARLEEAVEAITREMERLSESQRFVASLLADRAGGPEQRSLPPGRTRGRAPPR